MSQSYTFFFTSPQIVYDCGATMCHILSTRCKIPVTMTGIIRKSSNQAKANITNQDLPSIHSNPYMLSNRSCVTKISIQDNFWSSWLIWSSAYISASPIDRKILSSLIFLSLLSMLCANNNLSRKKFQSPIPSQTYASLSEKRVFLSNGASILCKTKYFA